MGAAPFSLCRPPWYCPLGLKPSLPEAPRVERGREDAQMIYTGDDLTPQWPRSRRMATCSCQDCKPHGHLLLCGFQVVRNGNWSWSSSTKSELTGSVWAGPKLKLRHSGRSPQEERGPHSFRSLHPFPQDSCMGREHLICWQGPLIDRNTSTVAGGGRVVAQSTMGCSNLKQRVGASRDAPYRTFLPQDRDCFFNKMEKGLRDGPPDILRLTLGAVCIAPFHCSWYQKSPSCKHLSEVLRP